MSRLRSAFAAAGLVAGMMFLSSPALATDANCPSATTPICRQYSCTGPLIRQTCTCVRWECAVIKDPSKGDKLHQSFPGGLRPSTLSR